MWLTRIPSALRRRVLGEEHPATLTSTTTLVVLYRRQQHLEQAEPLYLQALEAQRRVLGENHPQTLSTIGSLAELCRAQGRTEEAAQWRARLPTTQPAQTKSRPESEGD